MRYKKRHMYQNKLLVCQCQLWMSHKRPGTHYKRLLTQYIKLQVHHSKQHLLQSLQLLANLWQNRALFRGQYLILSEIDAIIFVSPFTFKFRRSLSIITLLSSHHCEGHVYKLSYHLVLHSRPILLDVNSWACTILPYIRFGFL